MGRCKAMSQDWQDLLAALEEQERTEMDGAWSSVDIHTLVYGLNLVQPFNWPQWSGPPLDYIRPDFTHVLAGGRIVRSGGPELALEVEERGYNWIEEHTAPAA